MRYENQEIGSMIKVFREFRNMTIKALSEKTGITEARLSDIERGTESATINEVADIGNALDAMIDFKMRPKKDKR